MTSSFRFSKAEGRRDPNQLSRRSVMQLAAATTLVSPVVSGEPQERAEKPFILGYPGRRSCVAGEKLTFHLSTNLPRVDVQVVRLGAATTRVWSRQGIRGSEHAVPKHASSHGCGWPVAFSLPISADWPSGCYEAWTSADHNGKQVHGNRMFFVVRSSRPGIDTSVLLQLATNTYNAYNGWGGFSLYTYWGVWDVRHEPGDVLGRRVSFQRPFAGIDRSWELPFIRWAEANGYALDYAVNNDLEFHPELLDHYRLVLSVGHDEYWSAAMRDNLEAFVAKGGNVAFFSGNVCCWQVRCEQEGNDLVCWKEAFEQDPLYNERGPNPLLSTLWSHHAVQRPENQLTGVGVLRGGFHNFRGHFMGDGGYTVHRPDHWVFEGTELREGEKFGQRHTVVGYEVDGCEFEMVEGRPTATGRDGTPKDFVILATAPARWGEKDLGWYPEWHQAWQARENEHGCMGMYTHPGGGTVFTAATTDWSHGLGAEEAVGALGPGHAVGVFSGDKWNVLGDHFQGKVLDEHGRPLPFELTIEFGAGPRSAPISNWGQVTQLRWVNANAPPGVGNNSLMNDMLYSSDNETVRQQGGVRLRGLPAGSYDVFALLRHFATDLAHRYEWAIGVDIDSLSGHSFVSPGGGSQSQWVAAGPDTPGNYARRQVTITSPLDHIVMIYDNLDVKYTEVMGFQIARIDENDSGRGPIRVQFDAGGGGGDDLVQRITRNVLDRLAT